MREMSKKSKYYLPKDRLKELTYFCRQYNVWKEAAYHLMDLYAKNLTSEKVQISEISCPVERIVEARENYIRKMDMVFNTIKQSVKELFGSNISQMESALFANICYGSTYEQLYFTYPEVSNCPRNKFYKLRQLFFWNLNKVRD